MKHFRKFLTLLLLMTVLVMLPVLQSAAAGEVGNVSKVTVSSVGETSAKLSWSKVSKADGYMIYLVDSKTSKLKKIKTTKSRSYTVSKLAPDEKYVYQVFAYDKVKGKTYISESGKAVSFKTKLVKPSKPAGFQVSTYGDGNVVLKWNKAKNATGYELYRYNETSNQYVKIKTTKERTIKVTGLKADQKYKFKLLSYRTKNGKTFVSAFSDVLEIIGKKFSAEAKSVSGRRHKATLKSETTVILTKTKEKVKLKKGTSITTTSRSTATVNAFLADGRAFKISRKKLKFGNLKIQKTYYSQKVKEAFVNSRGYGSSTKYLIWISQYTANVTIFKGSKGAWKVVRSMPCVIGRQGKTPPGVFKLDPRSRDYAYGGVRIYFTWNSDPSKLWGNSFHMRTSGTTRGAESSGCVRLGSSDLNYLARHCSKGTTVVSY